MKNLFLTLFVFLLLTISCKSVVKSNSDDNMEENKLVLINSNWSLIKLNGKIIQKSKNAKKELGIVFSDDETFSAYAGCNNMMGSYVLKEKENRITFSKVAMTMMACPDSEVENEFAKMLELADNYNFDGKILKLNKARMAPIAEFELIK